jgi:hypothetical protein
MASVEGRRKKEGGRGMRIEVEIAGDKRRLSDVDSQWVHEQVGNRRRGGRAVCVRVYVTDSGIDLRLSTPSCPTAGGSRPASPEERPIIDLWRGHHLDEPDFTGGDVVAFLRQLRG